MSLNCSGQGYRWPQPLHQGSESGSSGLQPVLRQGLQEPLHRWSHSSHRWFPPVAVHAGGWHTAPPPLLHIAHAAATPWLQQTLLDNVASRRPRVRGGCYSQSLRSATIKIDCCLDHLWLQCVHASRISHLRGVRLRNTSLSPPRLFPTLGSAPTNREPYTLTETWGEIAARGLGSVHAELV